MSDGQNERGRVLLLMSQSVSVLGVENALANLWTHAPREIHGLLLEDPNVIRSSLLAVSREVRPADASTWSPSANDMERQIRAHANRMRAAFEKAARGKALISTFRTARGSLAECLGEACADIDVVVVAAGRDRFAQRMQLRSQLQGLLSRELPTTVLLHRAPPAQGGIAVLFKATPLSLTALRTALELAEGAKTPLTVLLPATDEARRRQLRDAALEAVREHSMVGFHALGGMAEAEALVGATQRIAASLLVMSRDFGDDGEESAADILDRLNCSVILTG